MLLPLLLSILILHLPPSDGAVLAAWQFSAGGVVLLALVNAAFCWAGSGLAARLYRGAGDRGPLAASRVFTFLKGLTVGLVLADVVALQWPLLVERMVGGHAWQELAFGLVLPLPALAMMLMIVAGQYRFEARRGRVTLSLPAYVWLRFRVEMAIVLAPWMLLVVTTGVTALLWRDKPWYATADAAASGGVLLGIIVLSPWLLARILKTSRLPDGPLRERLEAFCRRTGFHCSEILLWHTHRHVANAGVVGPTPLLRYVMLTDLLLQNCSPEEVEAIFAHEVGHVRHKHIPFYLVMGVAFVAFYANLVDVAARLGLVAPLEGMMAMGLTTGQAVLMLAFAAFYWGVCFGWVSRRMEQQADIFALEAVEDPMAFVTAMSKLSLMSGQPRGLTSWRHFSIGHRIAYLQQALERPALMGRVRRRVRAVKVGALFLFALAVARLVLARPDLLGL